MRKLKLPGRDSSKPTLDRSDIRLIRERGIQEMKDQAERMVRRRLNNHRRAPPRGNPVYKAMHACNCRDREQLELAHRVSAEGELSESNIEAVTDLLTRWIAREYNFFMEEQEVQQSLQRFRPD